MANCTALMTMNANVQGFAIATNIVPTRKEATPVLPVLPDSDRLGKSASTTMNATLSLSRATGKTPSAQTQWGPSNANATPDTLEMESIVKTKMSAWLLPAIGGPLARTQ